jgi:ubiquinone biosynthesis protein COQ4
VREDIIALLHEPLEAARARLNIATPVAYLNALDVCADMGIGADQIQIAA